MPVNTQLNIIDALIKLYHGKFNIESNTWGVRLRMCTDEICDCAKEGRSIMHLAQKWEKSSAEFMKCREKYLFY